MKHLLVSRISLFALLTTACGARPASPTIAASPSNGGAQPTAVTAQPPAPPPGTIVQLVVGHEHACALRADGTVWCWGGNESGTLGHGALDRMSNRGASHVAAARVTLARRATAVSAGFAHTCALLDDATVQCWGSNSHGQRGATERSSSLTPAPVALPGPARSIGAGSFHNCAQLEDGSVACWGSDTSQQLGFDSGENCGVGSERLPCAHVASRVEGVQNARSLSVGPDRACVVTAEGAVQCWGGVNASPNAARAAGAAPRVRTIADLSGVQSVAMGLEHTCARTEHEVRCWGSNTNGELGTGSASTTPTPAPAVVPGLTDARRVEASVRTTCAIRADGTVACWGNNEYGLLGDGTGEQRNAPTEVPGVRSARLLAMGSHSACVVGDDNRVLCWGNNASGQIDWRPLAQHNLPPTTVTGIEGATSLAAGPAAACALTTGGVVRCWGALLIAEEGRAVRGTEHFATTPVAVPLPRPAVQVVAGAGPFCARIEGDDVYCWGRSTMAADGASAAIGAVPALHGATNLAIVLSSIACGVFATGPVRCVDLGRAGRPSTRPPATLRPAGVTAVTAYATRACSIAGGRVRCEGALLQYEGAEGENSGSFRGAEELRRFRGAASLATGQYHLCVLDAAGVLQCQGDFGYGHEDSATWVRSLRIENVRSVAAGGARAYAVLRDGTVQSFGENMHRTLGRDGDGVEHPTAIPGLSDVAEVASGESYACARTNAGAVSCWGDATVVARGGAGSVALRPAEVPLAEVR